MRIISHDRYREYVGVLGTVAVKPIHPNTWYKIMFPESSGLPLKTFRPTEFIVVGPDGLDRKRGRDSGSGKASGSGSSASAKRARGNKSESSSSSGGKAGGKGNAKTSTKASAKGGKKTTRGKAAVSVHVLKFIYKSIV